MPRRFTSWGAIYETLRAAFPDTRYHAGASILSFENTANGIEIELFLVKDGKIVEWADYSIR